MFYFNIYIYQHFTTKLATTINYFKLSDIFINFSVFTINLSLLFNLSAIVSMYSVQVIHVIESKHFIIQCLAHDQ